MTPEEITAKVVRLVFGGNELIVINRSCFERLLTLAVEKAVAKEREECAQLCDYAATRTWHNPRVYATAIRARGQKGGV